MTTIPSHLLDSLDSIVAEAEKKVGKKAVMADFLKPPPRTPPKKQRPTRAKTHEESFRDLDGFRAEADAGMPDDSLARAANVSLTAVLEWRKERGIKRKRGHERRREIEVWAIDPFGTGYVSDIQRTESVVKGQWDLPEYVLRLPLDYDQLTRALHFLHSQLGMSADTIAKAVGLRLRDAEMAIAVEAAHLSRVGVACKSCGRECDPSYGQFCSLRCRSEKK
jgi:hypothetical protein